MSGESTSETVPDVSVVLPVFNEVGHVEAEIQRIQRSFDDSDNSCEIIVVDDGSTDGSTDVLRRIDGIRLIEFEQNRGCGAARKAGTEVATGRAIAWTDVDMSYPNERIPELVDLLHGHDQVVGSRRTETGSWRFLRATVKWMIRQFAAVAMGSRIPDLNSGLRVFKRELAADYLDHLPAGFSCVTTITLSFLSDGHSIHYVPIDYSPRAGSGKFHWWTDTLLYVGTVLRLSVRHRPLRVAAMAAVGLAVPSALVWAVWAALA